MRSNIAIRKLDWPKSLFVNLFGVQQPIPMNLEKSIEKAMDIALDEQEKKLIILFYKDKLDRETVALKLGVTIAKASSIRFHALEKLYNDRLSRYILMSGIDQTERKMAGPVLEWHISFLHMPTRFYNSMDISRWIIGVGKEIDTVADLISLSRNDILKARGMGSKTVDMLEDRLAEYGLYLKKED